MIILIILAWWAIGFLSLLGAVYIISKRQNRTAKSEDVVECMLIGWLGPILLICVIDYLLSANDKK